MNALRVANKRFNGPEAAVASRLRLKTAARSGEGLVAIDDEDRAAFAVVGASSAEWTRNACIN